MLKTVFLFFLLISKCSYSNAVESLVFACVDGYKINLTQICDGVIDCPDSSDELKKLCYHILCPVSSYRCNYGACISKSFRCDGFQDCMDGSDEIHCETSNDCTSHQYQCVQSLECIPLSQTCNGYVDCRDKSDESAAMCKDYFCPAHTYQCEYGGCINPETICDGTNDCLDGSDEKLSTCEAIKCIGDTCLNYKCKPNEFTCKSGGQCISISQVCDGAQQCRDASDETLEICKNQQCPDGFFQCNYGACIPDSLKCNLEPNCHDWSDEIVCDSILPNGACRLPSAKPGTHYTVSQYPQSRPGQIVPELTRLDFSCDSNETLEGSSQAYCQNNNWVPYVPTCYSELQEITCPLLDASATKKRCQVLWGLKQGWILCNESMPIGTHVTFECPEFYKRKSGSFVTTCLHDGTWSQVPLQCEPICGTRDETATPLIVKGWEISSDESLPWHATLFSHENGHWKFFCGSSLIHESAVLTAGHCVWKTDPETIRVIFAGFSSNFTLDEENIETQITGVSKINIQQMYRDHEGNYGSDLAILILDKPVTITNNVKPVCLDWRVTSDVSLRSDEIGLVAGMGITENDTFSDKLRITTVKIIPENECQESQKRDFRKYLTYTTFCAGWSNGTAVCNGDSGGGLALQRPDEKIWDLHGVVSISPRRLGTNICDPNYYTVFTKVSAYSTWIDDILKDLPVIGPPQNDQLPNMDVIF